MRLEEKQARMKERLHRGRGKECKAYRVEYAMPARSEPRPLRCACCGDGVIRLTGAKYCKRCSEEIRRATAWNYQARRRPVDWERVLRLALVVFGVKRCRVRKVWELYT